MLFGRRRLWAILAFTIAFIAVMAWWATIKPIGQANWAPDVARQVTGEIDGDMLTLTNVCDFEWHGKDEFTERWATRTYDLGKLRTIDLFMSYWAGPKIAHVIISFGFEDGEQLAWSVEVRRRVGGHFRRSPICSRAIPL